MNTSFKLSALLLSTSLFLGCSGKSFSLQSYADEYFNEANQTTTNKKNENIEVTKEPNAAIKSGPGSDIAWSSTYKQDKKLQGQGSMQKGLDTWTKEEWEPAFEGDVNQTQKDKEANEHFTLQHYYDKSQKYLDIKEKENEGKPKEPSHYEKMKSLPVIGE